MRRKGGDEGGTEEESKHALAGIYSGAPTDLRTAPAFLDLLN